MEKLNEISNHLKNGSQLGGTFKVSQIVDSKSPNHKVNAFSSDSLNSSRSSSASNAKRSIISDLIPYPASSISTTIEKVNGTNSADWNYSDTRAQSINIKEHVEISTPPFETPYTKVPAKKCDDFSTQSSLNDNLSQRDSSLECPPETPSQQKVCSDPIMTFDSDYLVQVVKLLRERKESYTQTESGQTCNQYVQVNVAPETGIDHPNQLDLNRSNQTLRSQLDQLSYVIEEMAKERSSTTLQIHSLQKSLLSANSERDSLKDKLNQNSTHNQGLVSHLDSMKGELLAKEDHIRELYRAHSTNQEEIAALNRHVQSLNEQLGRSSMELQNLFAHKSILEQRLQSSAVVSEQNQTPIRSGVISRVESLKSECSSLRESLHLMKDKLICDYDTFNKECTARREHTLQVLRSSLDFHRQSAIQSKLAEKDTLKRCESEIVHLKQINEKMLSDIGKQIAESESVKEQLASKLASLQIENGSMKETIGAFQQKIVDLNSDCLRLREEAMQSANELAMAKQRTEQLTHQLNDAHSQISELDRCKEAQSANCENAALTVERLQRENEQLKTKATKLEEDQTQSTTRIQQLNAQQAEGAEQYKTQLASIQTELNHSLREVQVERQSKQESLDEINMLRDELRLRKDKIINLESNIQMLTKKYRELTQKASAKSEVVDQCCQTGESMLDMERMQCNLTELQQFVVDRDTAIANQNQQLEVLRTNASCNEQQTQEMRTRIDTLESSLQESERKLHEMTELPAREQQISDLQIDLAKEKERSKGLSQSLFNEKRLNNKLKREVNRLKQCEPPTKQVQSSPSNSVDCTERDLPDLGELDHEQLNAHLKARIAQIKTIATEMESRKMRPIEANSTVMSAEPAVPEHSSLLSSSSTEEAQDSLPNDFIIQMLQDPSEAQECAHNRIPLSKLHSSIEDIKHELNTLKQSLTCEPTALSHSPSTD